MISNIGSFGDGCFKIGMTRRLDPTERVWELSDASVPFDFDTRKEFFRVSLEEIQAAVTKLHGVITFVTEPEAEDYRLAMESDTRSRSVRLSVPAAAAV